MESSRYGDLLKRVQVIIFLGTPHQGSSIANFAANIAQLSNAVARSTLLPIWGLTRADLIHLLKAHSEELGKLTRDFSHRVGSVHIISAYENRSHAIGVPVRVAVA